MYRRGDVGQVRRALKIVERYAVSAHLVVVVGAIETLALGTATQVANATSPTTSTTAISACVARLRHG
jgi:hypothetical protein